MAIEAVPEKSIFITAILADGSVPLTAKEFANLGIDPKQNPNFDLSITSQSRQLIEFFKNHSSFASTEKLRHSHRTYTTDGGFKIGCFMEFNHILLSLGYSSVTHEKINTQKMKSEAQHQAAVIAISKIQLGLKNCAKKEEHKAVPEPESGRWSI
ncbi:MAG TPA: hypothetical protein VLF61_02700 [Rhabdochlamydiaceae bacterium]|nr:hypothetical protein [Rhabdochlamydiaceae bacterium]